MGTLIKEMSMFRLRTGNWEVRVRFKVCARAYGKLSHRNKINTSVFSFQSKDCGLINLLVERRDDENNFLTVISIQK